MPLWSTEYILAAFLIFVRVGSMMMIAPYFSSAVFPVRVRLFFALTTSMLLYPVIPAENVLPDLDSEMILVLMVIIQEVLTGLALGLVGQLLLAGLELGGSLISIQVALRFANIVDSMSQQQTAVISNMFNLLAILFFLGIEGEKIFILALANSFEVVPTGMSQLDQASPLFIEVAVRLFVIGVQIASPFLVVIFLLNLSFAIFARVMPQANIFFIALPLKIGIGLIVLIMVIPYFPVFLDTLYQELFRYLSDLLDRLSP